MSEAAHHDEPIGSVSPYGAPPRMGIYLTIAEQDLLLDALARAASRLESMAKTAKFGARHDETAMRMRTLRMRILRHKRGQPT